MGSWSLSSMRKNGYLRCKWSSGSIMWRCLLLILVSNLKEDQSAVVLVVHQALEVVPTVHCQGRNEINNHRNENRAWHSRKFCFSSFFGSHRSLLHEFQINHQLLRRHFLKKMIYLADYNQIVDAFADEHKNSRLILKWYLISSSHPTSSIFLLFIQWKHHFAISMNLHTWSHHIN